MEQEEVYPLDRSEREALRLNEQNKTLIDIVGFTVHPAIKPLLPAEPRIAEPGTGTAAFLISISNELPKAELHGFDISNVAFPKQLPNNITLSVADIKELPPPEHRGKYDLVCMRFLNAAFTPGDDWDRASAHAFSLLKPGGALQWLDGEFTQVLPVLVSHAQAKTEVLEKCAEQALLNLHHASWFTTHLRKVLESAGFEKVQRKVFSTDRNDDTRRGATTFVIGAIQSVLRLQAQRKAPSAFPEDEINGLVEGMKEEVQGGAYFRINLHQFVAFKPGS